MQMACTTPYVTVCVGWLPRQLDAPERRWSGTEWSVTSAGAGMLPSDLCLLDAGFVIYVIVDSQMPASFELNRSLCEVVREVETGLRVSIRPLPAL